MKALLWLGSAVLVVVVVCVFCLASNAKREYDRVWQDFERFTVRYDIDGVIIDSRGTITGIWMRKGSEIVLCDPESLVPPTVYDITSRVPFGKWFDDAEGQRFCIVRTIRDGDGSPPRFDSINFPNWVLEVHLRRGETPSVNTTNHGKYGEY